MANAFHNAGQIFDNIDKEFATKTKLNKRDVSFLFLAISLQCARWMLMPPLDFDFNPIAKNARLSAKDGDALVRPKQEAYLKSNQSKNAILSEKYWSWDKLVLGPVPYDAIKGTKEMNVLGYNKGLGGFSHRPYTLGHDPILGWIFGTLNILTRTMTINKPTLPTYHILDGNICGNQTMIFDALKGGILSAKEDSKRVAASVFKQSLHFASDKYTKLGLQLPLLSTEKAMELLNNGWNTASIEKAMSTIGKDVGIIALQAGASIFINYVIQALHLRCYNETEDGDLRLYEVRTRKILMYSNTIASTSNVITATLSSFVPQIGAVTGKSVRNLDIGGISITIYRLLSDHKFIRQVKNEFISEEFYNRIIKSDFEWRSSHE